MQLITLVTDWGTQDHFIGTMKAKLYSHIPNLQVVDISHNLLHFNAFSASFVVKNACLNFPPGTIHIIDIESIETKDYSHVLIEYNKQYYICTDNGLPSLVFPKDEIKIIQISMFQDSNFYTFAALDLFAKVAIELSNGCSLSDIGAEKEGLLERNTLNHNFQGNALRASVIYIDGYGNAYLNVTDNEFEKYRNGRYFELKIRNHKLDELSTSYNDVGEADMLLTISSVGYLQIAINKGSLAQLEGIHVLDTVMFTFHEDKEVLKKSKW